MYALPRKLTGQTELSGVDRALCMLIFPTRCRLRQRTQFEQALRVKPLINPWFAVHLQKNECGFSRLGIIASKRIMPKAVSRNFVKRLIREAFRQSFPRTMSLDVLVRARRQVTAEEAGEGRVALLQLLQSVPA